MKTSNGEPILASWKISEVIGRYPQLLDELIGLNPTFRMLRNPLVRRVQARLTTVAQAAKIAGMEPAVLVSELNQRIGYGTSDPAGVAAHADVQGAETIPVDVPSWVCGAPVVTEIDARPLQRQGKEPFGSIMAAAREVATEQSFVLRNTFEPLPLYDVLGQRGFEHWATQLGDDDWEIRFFNSGQVSRAPQRAVADQPPMAAPSDGLLWESPTATITIDVSELVPPEPLIRILETLAELPEGASLLVHHVRRPMHLYPRLDELGYRHETREPAPGRVELLIEKPAPGAEAEAQ